MSTHTPTELIRFGSTLSVVPSEHCKAEWSRMAQAAYHADRNDIGHRFSMASATTPVGGRMELKRYDSLMAEYRAWLVFGEWSEA